MLSALIHLSVIVLLTLVTQIGGLAYLVALLLRRLIWRSERWRRLGLLALFVLSYGGASYAAAIAAERENRVALPCWSAGDERVAVATPLYCLLNRHYVTLSLRDLADDLAEHMAARYPGTRTQALDAGFPLLTGFPLLPHVSHDDGRKLDLAFYYQQREGDYLPGALASPLGYWGFSAPLGEEARPCARERRWLSLRWDMAWFQPFVRKDLVLEEQRTRAALAWLSDEQRVSKILLEPHLKTRLGLASDKIRFQGCRAARHDDHLHLELRR